MLMCPLVEILCAIRPQVRVTHAQELCWELCTLRSVPFLILLC